MRWGTILMMGLLLLILTSCSQSNTAINKGFKYLDSAWNDTYSYNDDYLKFIYPGENLECPDCYLTYRKMDAFFDLVLIKQQDLPVKHIEYQLEEADSTLKKIMPLWEEGEIYNAITSEGDGYALDTYCIFGYIYKNKKMAEKVKSYLKNNNWMYDDYYKEDIWRNIADESWCVMLLDATNTDIDEHFFKKIEESYNFIEDEHEAIDKAAVMIHTIMMLYTRDEYNKQYDKKDTAFFQEYLYNLTEEPEVKDNNLILSNIVYVLIRSDYSKEKIRPLIKLLIERQSDEGAWYPFEEKSDYAQAFTTLRVIMALREYER